MTVLNKQEKQCKNLRETQCTCTHVELCLQFICLMMSHINCNTSMPFHHLSIITSKYILNNPPSPSPPPKKHLNLYLIFIHQPISSQDVASNNEGKCWYFNNHRNSVSTLEVGLPCNLSGEYPPFNNDNCNYQRKQTI